MSGYPWGGSEELWANTAIKLAQDNLSIAASVHGWKEIHPRILDLQQHGIEVQHRKTLYPAWRRVVHKIANQRATLALNDMRRFLEDRAPALIVISNGVALPPIELVELCVSMRLPFVTIAQANYENWWPEKENAARYRVALGAAVRCYFVSENNRTLAERQIGAELPNAEIVRNPFNASYAESLAWPTADDGKLLMACVARLHPPSKGQDLLFEALAGKPWDTREWRLTLYGEGPNRDQLVYLAHKLGLETRLEFRGHVSNIAEIWENNHLAVLPSRYEGLPLALVEAALCSRPALVTDVAGNSEVVNHGVTGFLAGSPTVPSLRDALEQAWIQRGNLPVMGEAAAKRIRELVPSDPAEVFALKLRSLISESNMR